MKYRDDSGGYTLQTIIVSAILLVVATTASVALYRAITTSADVRSFSDLTDEQAPTKPHNFTIEYDINDATIRWDAPLYTGTPQLGGSIPGLRYSFSGNCQDRPPPTTTTIGTPPTDPPPPATTVTLQLPLSTSALEVSIPRPTGKDFGCTLEVRAYDCPNSTIDPDLDPDCENERVGQRITGPPGEYEFLFTEAALAPRNFSIEATNGGLLISWEKPQNTGSSITLDDESTTEDERTLFYELVWGDQNNENACTFENYFIVPSTSLESITVTSYVKKTDVQINGIPCPSLENESSLISQDDRANDRDGNKTDSRYLLELPGTPSVPSEISLIPIPSELDLDNPVRLFDEGIYTDVAVANLTWKRNESSDSYLLEWSRADGIGPKKSREITNQEEGNPQIYLSLENGVGYDFLLSTSNPVGEASYEMCAAVATQTRPIKPHINVTPAGQSDEVLIQIAQPQNSCHLNIYCISLTCEPLPPAGYKIRLYRTDVPCIIEGTQFPNEKCTNNDIIVCIPVLPNDKITETIVSSLTPNKDYTVEVIARSTSCETPSGTFATTSFSFPVSTQYSP